MLNTDKRVGTNSVTAVFGLALKVEGAVAIPVRVVINYDRKSIRTVSEVALAFAFTQRRECGERKRYFLAFSSLRRSWKREKPL